VRWQQPERVEQFDVGPAADVVCAFKVARDLCVGVDRRSRRRERHND
jgi:hypothetical protein